MRKYNKTLSDFSLEEIKASSKINKNGCWEKGYQPTRKLNGREVKLSRIALALANPDFDINNPKIYACHKCDNDHCVNPDHLFPGTSSDNQKDHWKKVKDGKILHWANGRMANTIFGPLNLTVDRKTYRHPRWVPVNDD